MRKRNRIINSIIYVLLFILSFAGLVYLFFTIFKIKSIETNASSQSMNYFPNFDNTLIFGLDEEKIRRHFLSDSTIESIFIKKKYPDTLVITIIKREEAGMILAKNGVFKVDTSGFIYDTASSSSAGPVIHLEDKELNLGNNITHKTMLIAIQSSFMGKRNEIRFVDVYEGENESIRLILDNGVAVIIGTNRSAEEIVSSLQTLLKNITIEGKTVKEIDFRFDKPFISF